MILIIVSRLLVVIRHITDPVGCGNRACYDCEVDPAITSVESSASGRALRHSLHWVGHRRPAGGGRLNRCPVREVDMGSAGSTSKPRSPRRTTTSNCSSVSVSGVSCQRSVSRISAGYSRYYRCYCMQQCRVVTCFVASLGYDTVLATHVVVWFGLVQFSL